VSERERLRERERQKASTNVPNALKKRPGDERRLARARALEVERTRGCTTTCYYQIDYFKEEEEEEEVSFLSEGFYRHTSY
jgi:hypothetical protein